MDIEPLQPHHGDVDELSGFIAEWGMEVEFVEANERRHGRFRDGYLDALDLSWRPDPKALPLAPYAPFATKCVAKGEMKAVEFDMCVETFRQSLDNLGPHEGFSAMSEDVDNEGYSGEEQKYAAANPKRPPCSATRQRSAPPMKLLLDWMPELLDPRTIF